MAIRKTLFDKAMPGFSLSEVLIALLILAQIATFTIPKVLLAQQNQTYKAQAKEVIATISGAYLAVQQRNGASANTRPSDLTPYMNYVGIDTATVIDDTGPNSTQTCSATKPCLKLHSGGTLLYAATDAFGGTGSTNTIWFLLDPNGTQSVGSSNDKGLWIGLYYNGRITSWGQIQSNISSSYWGTYGACPTCDPSWFSW